MAKDTDDLDDLDDLTDDDFDLDEDFDLDDDILEQKEEPAATPPSPKKEESSKKEPQAALHPSATAPTAKPTAPQHVSVHDVQLSLVVEIGQVRLPLDKLLALEPGNLFDLNLRPEDGVNLVINGKTIGKGELIRMGDSIGVRILELGNSLVG